MGFSRRSRIWKEHEMLNFHPDTKRGILWVIHRKVAGTSLRKATEAQIMLPPDHADVQANRHLHTITVIRHPWCRITSAMYNPYTDDRPFRQKIQEEILDAPNPMLIDWHMRPQHLATDLVEIDKWVLYDNLADEWTQLQDLWCHQQYGLPDLTWENRGEHAHWREPDGEPYDWSPLLPIYEKDFALNPDWETE